MSYFPTAFETTSGSISDHNKIKQALMEALVSTSLPNTRFGVEPLGNRSAVFVTGGDYESAKIPAFIHPYLIKGFKGEDYLVTDLRLFKSNSSQWQSEKNFEDSVRNKSEYAFTKARAVLNHLWLKDDYRVLRTRFSFACSVFAAWLSQVIAKAYALDFHDQYRIMAVSVYYYHLLFSPEKKLTEEALETAVIHTIKVTNLQATEIYEMFEKLGDIGSISDFCKELQVVVENVRLKDFNLAMLLSLIRNSWFATNAKEILPVALEHPPTWITIVASTMTERSFSSSPLYKVIEFQMKKRNGGANEFTMNYAELMRDSVLVLESADNTPLTFKDF